MTAVMAWSDFTHSDKVALLLCCETEGTHNSRRIFPQDRGEIRAHSRSKEADLAV
jgi:hypothetical protein